MKTIKWTTLGDAQTAKSAYYDSPFEATFEPSTKPQAVAMPVYGISVGSVTSGGVTLYEMDELGPLPGLARDERGPTVDESPLNALPLWSSPRGAGPKAMHALGSGGARLVDHCALLKQTARAGIWDNLWRYPSVYKSALEVEGALGTNEGAWGDANLHLEALALTGRNNRWWGVADQRMAALLNMLALTQEDTLGLIDFPGARWQAGFKAAESLLHTIRVAVKNGAL